MEGDRTDRRTTGIVEARRRAAIIRRYVAIDLPTAEDDRRFAEELGLAEDTLSRLATAWRLNRDARLLAGPQVALSRHDAPDRAAIMAEIIDMEGVDPDRRSEMMCRIRGIQAYLLARERGNGDSRASAAAVGVSRARFKDLVNRWRMHAKASAMPGARRGTRIPRRNEAPRRRRIEILQEILDRYPEAPIARIHAHHADACRSEGLEPLSLPRIYGLVREMRHGAARAQSGGDDALLNTST